MNILQEKLVSAIQLRESQKQEEACKLLLELHAEFPDDPQVHYGSKFPCAWIHDLLALEREAILSYEKAIQMGLNSDDLKSALLSMRSRILANIRKRWSYC